MSAHNKNESSISVMEAVETLSHIADIDFENDPGLTQFEGVDIKDRSVWHQTLNWLRQKDGDHVFAIVKETFRVILTHLRHNYSPEPDPKSMEGIKNIMLVVGEAAKKLDRHTELFKKLDIESVTELKEYRKLQDFYQHRIARRVDQGTLSKWLLALSQKIFDKAPPIPKDLPLSVQETKHVFVDLDAVKKDSEYELFFIRKEDGTRFFSPRLIRNIKLVSDFGSNLSYEEAADPLADVLVWMDKAAQSNAKKILKANHSAIKLFYKETKSIRDNELIDALHKSVLALMLSANQQNLWHDEYTKSSIDYFADYQMFLRQALYTRDYQKIAAYSTVNSSKLAAHLINLANGLCRSLYVDLSGYHELTGLIKEIIDHVRLKDSGEEVHRDNLYDQLNQDYKSMNRAMRAHPNGPLNKVLDIVEQGQYHVFDSILQGNIPNTLYAIETPETPMLNIRLPSPTRQEFIHKVTINEEFKAFLRACNQGEESSRLLLFNQQDRTSWREHHRSNAIEDLQNNSDFNDVIDVATLAYDTDFYYQAAPYHSDHQTTLFIAHLKEHLLDPSSGYAFSERILSELEPELDALIDGVHRTFFGGKNVLTREARLDFIEITYLFIQLKCLDIIQPQIFAFSCKDGVDLGMASSGLLYAFLQLVGNHSSFKNIQDDLRMLLFGIPLLIRERLMIHERFLRMLSALNVIEQKRSELGIEDFRTAMHKLCQKLKINSAHWKIAS